MNKITKIFFLSLLLYTLQTLYALSTYGQLVPNFRVNDNGNVIDTKQILLLK